MFRRFISLLVLMVAPAFAQDYTYSIQEPIAVQTYEVTETQTTSLDNIQQTGTSIPLYDDGVEQNVSIGFDFYFYGNVYDSVNISQNGFISFTSFANGCCSGYPLPYFIELDEYNESYFQWISVNNSIFAMWSDLIDFSFGNPYYQRFDDRFTVGWYNIEELGSSRYECDETGCIQTSGPNLFNFEITLYSNNNFAIRYGDFDFNNETWRNTTAGIQGDQENESYEIYHGTNSGFLENKTFLFTSSLTSIPEEPEEPEEPEQPKQNCLVNPSNPNCIINAATEPNNNSESQETPTNSTSEESVTQPAPEPQMLAAASEEQIVEKPLEELLASKEESLIRELADDEKSKTLEDSIAKNTLEAALSVAEISTATTMTAETSAENTSTRREASLSGASETLVVDSGSAAIGLESSKDESYGESESLSGLDILETGRQLGQEALAATLSAVETSAADSMNEAQSIAATSSVDSLSTSASTLVTQTIDSNESLNELENSQQNLDQLSSESETFIVEMNETTINTDQEIIETTPELMVAQNDFQQEQIFENNTSVETQETQSAIDFTTYEQAVEMFANNLNSSNEEQSELENNIIQQSLAQSQINEEDNKMSFSEAEAITIANDPALANAFNLQPNTANLELLGVIGNANQDKSDAEIRAEQVVAANKEEQDAINANYMEADQSGILAAIGSETDVTAYRSAMLNDNNIWYRPEDIYKNIVIRDNVRGMYFLEKGSTDTYKQMVEEQYKNE